MVTTPSSEEEEEGSVLQPEIQTTAHIADI